MNYEQLQEMLAMMDKTGAKAVRFPRRNGGFKPNSKKDEKLRLIPTNGTRKCINCGGAHETRECPKPQVSREDRPCWRCGKTGHIGANCPNKPNGQKAAAMVAAEPAVVVSVPGVVATVLLPSPSQNQRSEETNGKGRGGGARQAQRIGEFK